MKALNFFRQKKACALDVGQSWAKVALLTPARKGVSIERIGRLVWDRGERDKKDQVVGKLNALWRNLALRDKTVVSSMAGHAVIIKRVDLPNSEISNLDENIYSHAKQFIPFDIEDVFLDYQVMGPGSEEDTQNVLLVASKKKVVQEQLKLFERAGLEAAAIDVDGFALSNCFEYNYPELADKPSYLLDIGATHGVFCVYSNKQPIFIRDVSFGGQQVTERLAKALEKKQAETEKVKIAGGNGLNKEQQEEMQRQMDRIFSTWSEEIQRLINFYLRSQEQPQTAEKLFLSGGGSLMTGLSRIFSEQLGLEVSHLDPWRNISWNDNKIDSTYLRSVGPQFAIATGLALRTVT
jgi:type IV pilus assembly protein PilM